MADCGKLAPSYIHTVAGTAGGSVTTPDRGTFNNKEKRESAVVKPEPEGQKQQ